jgi:hypothetical protein
MTWSALSSILDKEINAALEARRKNSPSDPIAAVHSRHEANLKLEIEWSIELDAACRHFARYRTWPLLPPEVAALIAIRLRFAREFLQFLRGRRELRRRLPVLFLPRRRASLEHALVYLLVHCWQFAGRYRWTLCALILEIGDTAIGRSARTGRNSAVVSWRYFADSSGEFTG